MKRAIDLSCGEKTVKNAGRLHLATGRVKRALDIPALLRHQLKENYLNSMRKRNLGGIPVRPTWLWSKDYTRYVIQQNKAWRNIPPRLNYEQQAIAYCEWLCARDGIDLEGSRWRNVIREWGRYTVPRRRQDRSKTITGVRFGTVDGDSYLMEIPNCDRESAAHVAFPRPARRCSKTMEMFPHEYGGRPR